MVIERGESSVRNSPHPLLFLFISDLQMVEWKQRLQAQQQRHDASKEHLNQMQKSHSTVKAGVEHLAGKLHHIKLVNRTLNVSTKMTVLFVSICHGSLFSSMVKMSVRTMLMSVCFSSRQKREHLRPLQTQMRLCSHS